MELFDWPVARIDKEERTKNLRGLGNAVQKETFQTANISLHGDIIITDKPIQMICKLVM